MGHDGDAQLVGMQLSGGNIQGELSGEGWGGGKLYSRNVRVKCPGKMYERDLGGESPDRL